MRRGRQPGPERGLEREARLSGPPAEPLGSSQAVCYERAAASRDAMPISHTTPGTVLTLLAQRAAELPARPAVTDERVALTFGDLLARVTAGADRLADAGVGRGARVAILLPTSVEFVEALLSVLACGASALPLHPGTSAAEMRRVLADSRATALIAHQEIARIRAPEHGAAVASAEGGVRVLRPLASSRRLASTPPPRPADDALIAYSSGTTGRPHAVVRTHENLWWEAENFWNATQLAADDRILCVLPLAHAHGLGNALLASLRSGARLVLRPRFLRRATLDLLAHERITVFPTVPFMVRMLTATDRRRRWDLAALRLCFSAGAPLARGVFDGFQTRFRIPVRQLYGTTEAGSVALNMAPPDSLDPESVGRPLGSVRVTIEDARGRDLPLGESGEIVVRSPAATGGSDAALRTRDLGHWSAAHELVITGRTSLFINAAGNKIDPAEVEAALRLHPAVADVAVFGIPAPHGEQAVAAAVVPAGHCTADSLRVHCRALLAGYKVPRVVIFRSALPRSPLGKVLIGHLIAEA